MSRLVSWWGRLIDPTISIVDNEARFQIQLVTAISLILLGLTILIYLPYLLVNSNPAEIGVFVLLISCFTVAYAISRRGRYKLALTLLNTVLIGLIFFLVSVAPGPDVEFLLYYLTIPIILTSAIISLQAAVILTLVLIGLSVFLAFILPYLSFSELPIFFLVTMALLYLVLQRHRMQIERLKQEQIAQTNQRYERLFDAIKDGVIIHRDYVILYANPAFCSMLQTDAESIEQQNLFKLVPVDMHPLMQERFAQAEAEAMEVTIPQADGTSMYVEVVGQDFFDGNHTLRVTSFRDITARKLAQQRETALKVEQERTALLKRFIRDASHDLRTPLSVIFSSLHLINRTDDDERKGRHLDKIDKHARDMRDIVENLLAITNLDRAITVPSTFQTQQINIIVQNTLDHLQSLANNTQVKLEARLGSTLLPVAIITQEIQLAVHHLVKNAITFSPEQAVVIVTTSYRNDEIIISVKDDGIGITPEEQAHIFDMFYRVDEARSNTSGGMGVGLAICERVARLHDGRIEVISAPGKGSTFCLILPVVNPTEEVLA